MEMLALMFDVPGVESLWRCTGYVSVDCHDRKDC